MIYRNKDGSIYKLEFGIKPATESGIENDNTEEIYEITEVLNYLLDKQYESDYNFSEDFEEFQKGITPPDKEKND